MTECMKSDQICGTYLFACVIASTLLGCLEFVDTLPHNTIAHDREEMCMPALAREAHTHNGAWSHVFSLYVRNCFNVCSISVWSSNSLLPNYLIVPTFRQANTTPSRFGDQCCWARLPAAGDSSCLSIRDCRYIRLWCFVVDMTLRPDIFASLCPGSSEVKALCDLVCSLRGHM